MLAIFSENKLMNTRALYLIAAVLSVLLSCWINLREEVINPDAICYLLSAETISQQGINAGMHLCPQAIWPFYSFLLASMVKLTHLSYLAAAYLLDGFFTLLSVLTFIAIIDALGGSKRVLWLAAAVILLSHEFNFVRQYIVRDHGFWAFYLVSFYFLLKYCRDNLYSPYAFGWSVSIILASLFRIEGAVFLLTLPAVTFFCAHKSWRERLNAFVTLHALTLVSVTSIAFWMVMHPEITLAKLGRLHEVTDQLQHGFATITDRYNTMRIALIEHALPHEAARDASIVLVLTMLVWYLLNLFGNLSWIYSALVIYAWCSRAAQFARPALLVVCAYLLVNLVITASFFTEHLFLAKRYLIAFSLTLMIWVPFALERLIAHNAQRRLLFLTVLLIAASGVGGIFDFGYSKIYIRDAGNWLAANVPAASSVLMNDKQLMYYSKHYRDSFYQQSFASDKWQQYDYIALRVPHDPDAQILAVMKEMQLTSIKEFANKRGDRVVIYRKQ